jgi:hypothetical protein
MNYAHFMQNRMVAEREAACPSAKRRKIEGQSHLNRPTAEAEVALPSGRRVQEPGMELSSTAIPSSSSSSQTTMQPLVSGQRSKASRSLTSQADKDRQLMAPS